MAVLMHVCIIETRICVGYQLFERKGSHSVNEIIEHFHVMLCVGVCGETSGAGV